MSIKWLYIRKNIGKMEQIQKIFWCFHQVFSWKRAIAGKSSSYRNKQPSKEITICKFVKYEDPFKEKLITASLTRMLYLQNK